MPSFWTPLLQTVKNVLDSSFDHTYKIKKEKEKINLFYFIFTCLQIFALNTQIFCSLGCIAMHREGERRVLLFALLIILMVAPPPPPSPSSLPPSTHRIMNLFEKRAFVILNNLTFLPSQLSLSRPHVHIWVNSRVWYKFYKWPPYVQDIFFFWKHRSMKRAEFWMKAAEKCWQKRN